MVALPSIKCCPAEHSPSPQTPSVVIPKDQVSYAARLRLVLDLVGEPVDGLRATLHRVRLNEFHLHPAARADLQGRRKTHLVEPVVQGHVEPLHDAYRPEQPGGGSQGQEPVLDCGPERTRRST